MLFIIIISYFIFITKSELNKYYGNYCGVGNYAINGTKPIDLIDRQCQIHDVCYSAINYKCFCHEQLYYSVSNIKPINDEQLNIKNHILRYMFLFISRCENYNSFDKIFIISKFTSNNIGFHFIPFYGRINMYVNSKHKYLICDPLHINNINQENYINCKSYIKKNRIKSNKDIFIVNPNDFDIKIEIK